MLPNTMTRVPSHTTAEVNRSIREQTDAVVRHYAEHPDQIDIRLQETAREWDIERALEMNASIVTLAGLALGILVNRKWLALSVIAGGFLLQHAMQGWCPPVPIMRRLGFRTQPEIDEERYALKALRGDFDDYYTGSIAEPAEHARAALSAARA